MSSLTAADATAETAGAAVCMAFWARYLVTCTALFIVFLFFDRIVRRASALRESGDDVLNANSSCGLFMKMPSTKNSYVQ